MDHWPKRVLDAVFCLCAGGAAAPRKLGPLAGLADDAEPIGFCAGGGGGSAAGVTTIGACAAELPPKRNLPIALSGLAIRLTSFLPRRGPILSEPSFAVDDRHQRFG